MPKVTQKTAIETALPRQREGNALHTSTSNTSPTLDLLEFPLADLRYMTVSALSSTAGTASLDASNVSSSGALRKPRSASAPWRTNSRSPTHRSPSNNELDDSYDLPIFSLHDTFSTGQPVGSLPFETWDKDLMQISSAQQLLAHADQSPRSEGSTRSSESETAGPNAETDAVVPRAGSATQHWVAAGSPAKLDTDSVDPFPLAVDKLKPNLNIAPPNWLEHDPRHNAHKVLDSWNPMQQSVGVLELLASMGRERTVEQDGFSATFFDSHADPVVNALADRGTSGEDQPDTAQRGNSPVSAPNPPRQRIPDIVCSAEDLKQLILAPHSDHPFALMVHRVGPSLIMENTGLFHQTMRVKDARKKTLFSKLLYYSILAEGDDTPSSGRGAKAGSPAPSPGSSFVSTDGTSLPQSMPFPFDPAAPRDRSSKFRRRMMWSFDELRLLLGVDTPLLRRTDVKSKEEMTLQIHDEDEYITRLEALEYWLDNIINNIDNVAICYHRDGEVQGYQVVNTHDIPSLGSERFEPIAVYTQASKMLHWLQHSCNRSGGSYIIVKDQHSSSLRIYDLAKLKARVKLVKTRPQDAPTVADEPAQRVAPSGKEVAGKTGRSPKLVLPPSPKPQMGDSQLVSPKLASAVTTSPTPMKLPPPQHKKMWYQELDEFETGEGTSASNSTQLPRTEPVATAQQQPPANDGHDAQTLEIDEEVDLAKAFQYPIAMMCYRMAQCVPNSDAEGHRLVLKCLDLLGQSVGPFDVEHSPIFASCHTQSMLYYHSSSPQSDAEDRCLSHARDATRALQLTFEEIWHQEAIQTEALREANERVRLAVGQADDVVATAREELLSCQRRAKQWVESLRDARAMTNIIVRCLCSIAVQHLRQWRSSTEPEAGVWPLFRILSMVQCLLLLRRREIPSGLLSASPHQQPCDMQPGQSSSAADGSADNSTSAFGDPTQVGLLTDSIRAELVACLASVETIVGDIFHELLVEAVQVKKDSSSRSDGEEGSRLARAVKRSVERCRREEIMINAAEQCHRSGVDLPYHLDYVGYFDGFSGMADDVFERGVASYNRAAAHLLHLQRSPRELKRKIGGFFVLMANTKTELLTHGKSQQSPEQQQRDLSRQTQEVESSAKTSALDEIIGLVTKACDCFIAAGDGSNYLSTKCNLSTLLIRKAESAFLGVDVYSVQEMAQLRRALQELDRSIDLYNGCRADRPSAAPIPTNNSQAAASKDSATPSPTLSTATGDVVSGTYSMRAKVHQALANRMLSTFGSMKSQSAAPASSLVDSIVKHLEQAIADLKQAKLAGPLPVAVLTLGIGEAILLGCKDSLKEVSWLHSSSSGTTASNARPDGDVAATFSALRGRYGQAIARFRAALPALLPQLGENAAKCVILLCETYAVAAKMISGFVNVGGTPALLATATISSASSPAAANQNETAPQPASFNDELLELWEKALTTLCDFKPWVVFHLNRIGEVIQQQQSLSQRGKAGTSGASASPNNAPNSALTLARGDVKILDYCSSVGEALTTSLVGLLKCLPKDEPANGSASTFRGKLSAIAGALMKGRPTPNGGVVQSSVEEYLSFAKLVVDSLQQVSDVFSGSRKKPKR